MKKIELLDNETFTIKGVYGETYVFDGDTLFVDSSGVSRKAVVLKSLRTEKGAEEWLRTAGRSYSGAQVFDTETLKSFEGKVVTLKALSSGKEDMFDEKLPFHVVMTEGDDSVDSMEDEMDSMDAAEEMESPLEEKVELEEIIEDDEQGQDMSMTQVAQVLHDAQKIYDMLKDEERLEPWMQAKLVKVTEYMNALSENLEHSDGDLPEDFEIDTDAAEDDDMTVDEVQEEVMEVEDEDEKKSVPAEPVMMAMDDKRAALHSEKETSVAGKVFKSLHAARQWNRFENPDKERYYIDIMREKDARKGFSKSTGLNAKYVVRDRMEDDDDTATKGAYGNKKVVRKVTEVPPVAKIDPETLRVAAIKE